MKKKSSKSKSKVRQFSVNVFSFLSDFNNEKNISFLIADFYHFEQLFFLE